MLRWLTLGAVLMWGCDSRSPTPESSGASHWLLPCAADTDCGALICECGQCALPCEVGGDACAVGECVADACGAEALCRPLTEAEESADNAVMMIEDAPAPADGWAAGPEVTADSPRGVWQFHRPSVVDANVLELRADGTFVFTLGGCDAVDCAWGTWALIDGAVRLAPPMGEATFRWPDEFAMHPVSAVELSPSADGAVAAVAAPDRDGYAQAWLSRGLAVDCVDWSVGLSDAPAEAQHCQSPPYPEQ